LSLVAAVVEVQKAGTLMVPVAVELVDIELEVTFLLHLKIMI
jgi:hypothetical protein